MAVKLSLTDERDNDEGSVPLDLSKVGAGAAKPLLEPRAIYSALPHRPWPYLRHEQGEVLERWFDRRGDHDVVIKQNTGGGKTVVGLLIAQSTLNEAVGPAVYLAPDTYLAQYVRTEASRLGLATVNDPRDAAFRSGRAILVTTFHKLVNGKSVFGVAGDGRDVPNLGVVIVDDAHAALTTAEGQFRLAIPPSHDAYQALITIFDDVLAEQSRTVWADIKDGDFTAVLRVPFWAWSDRQDDAMEVLHPHRFDDDFKWAWPLIADVLHLCTVTVTSRGVEIRPPCPPIYKIPAFVKAARRVYLTATLADDSVLVIDLDADPDMIARPVTPGSAADIGDRMILAPIELNPSIDDEAIRLMARQFADGDRDGEGVVDADPVNVVVLVPSNPAADRWSAHADAVHRVTDLDVGIAALKAGHVGLVVLVNKYDGIDLPDDACRLLVIDGVPRPLDGVERREMTALSGSPILLARQVQRVEQGMGRGVRDTNDHCVVLLLGSDLALAIHDPQHRALLSPATRAQVDLSRDVAGVIEGQGLGAVREAINTCLSRDPQWVTLSRRALADIRYAEKSVVRSEAVAQRRAFDAATSGQYSKAAQILRDAVSGSQDAALRGWLGEQQATYTHLVDAAQAQRVLTSAVQANPHLLRPVAGVQPAKIKAAKGQARAAATFLAASYEDGTSLVLGVRALLDEIDWDNASTPEAEAAWSRLGEHLGFTSQRPEQLFGTGPDGLWALTSDGMECSSSRPVAPRT